MRRLAEELDTGPASLYVYVRNMAELHGASWTSCWPTSTPPSPATRACGGTSWSDCWWRTR
ncbi:hypothetical protein AB0368_38300 [Actinoplanes sp. NPDC051475]|uniref:hypothetical protein n=1 Tax=Actinoplanes sp. NPDC051475 TaxID=3157225 RepID=UPI00344D9D9C